MADDLEKSAGEFKVHYSHKPIKEIARKLRADQTKSEAMLWGALRNRQLNGLKFLRQHPVGATIVDFYCHNLRLAIEIDGAIHLEADANEHDKVRQVYIEAYDIRFLRFTADEVESNLTDVIQKIAAII